MKLPQPLRSLKLIYARHRRYQAWVRSIQATAHHRSTRPFPERSDR